MDHSVRVLSALLAMTTWPEQEQAYKPHGVHTHARKTREFLAEAEYHPAVLSMQEVLESGETLDTIFSYAALLHWPGLRLRGKDAPEWAPKDWPAQIRDFAHSTRISELWDREKAAWESAAEESRRALEPGNPVEMLQRFFGSQPMQLIFVPNISYPTAQSLGYRDGKRLVCIVPPPIAWGTNPPWPYDDNPGDTPRDVFSTYARVLLAEMLDAHPDAANAVRRTKLPIPNTFRARHPEWFDQFAVLLVSGITALYLRETFGEVESKAYVMMVHKAHGFEALPSVIDVLENYLQGQAVGKYVSFIEYLPAFTKSLRVAERLKKV
jgi:hypothetical protein